MHWAKYLASGMQHPLLSFPGQCAFPVDLVYFPDLSNELCLVLKKEYVYFSWKWAISLPNKKTLCYFSLAHTLTVKIFQMEFYQLQ